MHHRRKVVIVAAAIFFGTPAAAQVANDGGVPTATQERLAHGQDDETIWNVIGLFGLIGAFGLWRASDNDGYTDDPI